jgi:hypothetical protein
MAMPNDEQINWERLLEIDSHALDSGEHQRVSVARGDLEGITSDFSRLIYATERRFHDTADRLIYEHRERFRQDLIDMNNIRMRLDSMLRNSK